MAIKPLIGIGGAPTRATTFPDDAQGRKERPVASGVLDYFPDAIVAVAEVSWKGNEQHNAGQPLHWARGKSGDEGDALMRHFLQRGSKDTDGMRHSAKVAWRALALLQKEIEAEKEVGPIGRQVVHCEGPTGREAVHRRGPDGMPEKNFKLPVAGEVILEEPRLNIKPVEGTDKCGCESTGCPVTRDLYPE